MKAPAKIPAPEIEELDEAILDELEEELEEERSRSQPTEIVEESEPGIEVDLAEFGDDDDIDDSTVLDPPRELAEIEAPVFTHPIEVEADEPPREVLAEPIPEKPLSIPPLAALPRPDAEPASTFEIDDALPPLPEEIPGSSRSPFFWVAFAVCAVAFVGGGTAAWWLGREVDATTEDAPGDEPAPEGAEDTADPSDEDPAAAGDEDPSAAGDEDPESPTDPEASHGVDDTTEAGADSTPSGDTRSPLGPDDPIEGLESEFDPSAFGVEVQQSNRSQAALNRRARHFLVRANRDRARGELEDAKRRYLEILGFNPRNVPATVGVVRVFLAQEDGPNAVLFAQRVARLRPDAASSFVLLADTFLVADDSAAARRSLEHALSLDRRHRGARRRLRNLAATDPE